MMAPVSWVVMLGTIRNGLTYRSIRGVEKHPSNFGIGTFNHQGMPLGHTATLTPSHHLLWLVRHQHHTADRWEPHACTGLEQPLNPTLAYAVRSSRIAARESSLAPWGLRGCTVQKKKNKQKKASGASRVVTMSFFLCSGQVCSSNIVSYGQLLIN